MAVGGWLRGAPKAEAKDASDAFLRLDDVLTGFCAARSENVSPASPHTSPLVLKALVVSTCRRR
jgi:hypothetical protein